MPASLSRERPAALAFDSGSEPFGRNARCTNSSLDGVQYAIHDGTNAALHSGPQGSRQPTAATIRRAQQNDLDAIVLRSVIG
jgi:hypothetical protein